MSSKIKIVYLEEKNIILLFFEINIKIRSDSEVLLEIEIVFNLLTLMELSEGPNVIKETNSQDTDTFFNLSEFDW